MVDAICRTLYRLAISRRNLLEWVTAAQSQLASQPGLAGIYKRMSASVLAALSARSPDCLRKVRCPLGGAAVRDAVDRGTCDRTTDQRIAAGRRPFADLRRRPSGVAPGRASHLAIFRNVRRHHRSRAATGQLSRGSPQPVVAHRTSPTNMGLYLLCVVSARDFGWTGTLESIERLGSNAGDHAATATISRPLLQLV